MEVRVLEVPPCGWGRGKRSADFDGLLSFYKVCLSRRDPLEPTFEGRSRCRLMGEAAQVGHRELKVTSSVGQCCINYKSGGYL